MMYSRPTAFGPPLAGWITSSLANEQGAPADLTGSNSVYKRRTIYDSFNGYNPAYTPPYMDGEAWADFIFRPSASGTYDLERILSEINVTYWRFDAGPTTPDGYSRTHAGGPSMEPSFIYSPTLSGAASGVQYSASAAPYGGWTININSMQLSASLDLFGVERVQFAETDKFGNEMAMRNTTTGKKWVIQPKFETPMVNFANYGIRPLSSSMIDMPVYASASVPRGMWHQFGVIPQDPNIGIFLEISDIPSEWLRYHYSVINYPSIYNNQSTESGERAQVYKKTQSLTSLMGFDKVVPKRRLGEIKESLTVKEAIVAVPYILSETKSKSKSRETSTTGKSFISIPQERFKAALKVMENTNEGDSLETAGVSIREQLEKMQHYVLPPEFNFIDNRSIDPVVMYIFEFSYTFDQNDLSYIWQNLAPRNYKKITTQSDSVTHTLANNEILSQKNLLDNPNLRWMVFKVKQRSQANYYDFVPAQRKQASKKLFENTNPDINIPDPNKDYLQYNWPYDYLSFVELIKMDAEVLFSADAPDDTGTQTFKDSTDLVADAVLEAIMPDKTTTKKVPRSVDMDADKIKNMTPTAIKRKK